MQPSRREFVKWVTASGIALSLSRLGSAEEVGFATRETLPGRQNWNPAANGAGRIDGVAKVTGTKLYASDFRAADLPGWPATTSHAILVRAPDATHVYTGMDLARLSGALKPSVVVTAEDLAKIGTGVPEFYAGDLFCPVGKTPLYLGQPVALLIFEKFDAFDQARLALRDGTFVRFGEETGPVVGPNYGAFRFTRVAGATPDAPDVYSPVKNGWVSPGHFQDSERPIWARLPIPTGRAYAEAATHGEQIRAELAASNPAVLVLDREFETQSVDPMFLEPEGGIAWYDAGAKNLALVLGVQSPYETAEGLAYMLGNARVPFKPAHIKTLFAYMGGGFGGRDHTPFPLYVALAAIFLPGRPVRLAQDRYQQFQGGIKRHAFKIRTHIGVDRATGKISGFAADHVLDGGGLANFSANIASVGAIGAIGIYDIPKVDITTVALHSRGVTAGSMRGYGTLQTSTALANRVAAHLGGVADEVTVHEVDTYGALALVTSGNSYTMNQATQDVAAKNPRWVPAISSATFASNGAHVGTQAAAEAARVIFRFGLWPAALELWGIAPTGPTAKEWAKAQWKDGQLIMPGLAPLPLPAVAAKAHARNGVARAMAHAFSRWGWSRATFPVAGQTWTADIDALAVRRGGGKYARLDRVGVKFPPTDNNRFGKVYTTTCGTLVRVEIVRATGALRIAKAYSVFECGKALVPEVVLGQAQGGFAMGVGYALFETLPPYEGGPGNGQWNLGQYLVARGSDLPLRDLEIEVLPPVTPDEPPKGMAEVLMIPVVAAILNAIFDATGRRFQSLPVTQATLKGGLPRHNSPPRSNDAP